MMIFMNTDVPEGAFDSLDDLTAVLQPYSSQQCSSQQYSVSGERVGTRLDKLCAEVFADFSRAQLQQFIQAGELLVNHQHQKANYRVRAGDVLTLQTIIASHSEDLPEAIDIDVVYVDDEVLVINKPAGLVVHPGAGNRTGTLVNALLYHFPKQAHLPRAGLVHRIDKDTTGLLVVARTKSAQLELIEQLKDKTVYRLYQCVVAGVPSAIMSHALIDLPMARHSIWRTKMAVKTGGKPAITHIVSAQALSDDYSLLQVRLQTGRTHQIRVHLSHLGFALVGDKVYGSAMSLGLAKTKLSPKTRQFIKDFARQALHAHTLGFIHPASKEPMQFSCELPADMQALIAHLQAG